MARVLDVDRYWMKLSQTTSAAARPTPAIKVAFVPEDRFFQVLLRSTLDMKLLRPGLLTVATPWTQSWRIDTPHAMWRR